MLRGRCRYEGQDVWRTKLSQSYPPRLTETFAVFTKMANEMRDQAMGLNLPIPHAEDHHDDGLPWEEATSESGNWNAASDSEDDSLIVPYGNNLSKDLVPLEHVYLSVLASQKPRVLKIPEQMLLNIKALFHLSPETMNVDSACQRDRRFQE